VSSSLSVVSLGRTLIANGGKIPVQVIGIGGQAVGHLALPDPAQEFPVVLAMGSAHRNGQHLRKHGMNIIDVERD
jgi:hypothetical protein